MMQSNRMRSLLVCSVAVTAILMTGCSSRMREAELRDSRYYYNRGMEFVEKGNYTQAQIEFQTVVDSFAGSEVEDSAQFMLAETYFHNEDYVNAAYEYERLYVIYPSSEHAGDALFMRAVCFFQESPKSSLDQENTLLAIEEFDRFIDTYPRHDRVDEAQDYMDELQAKLAHKEYMNAEIYRKLKKYDSAIIYYRFVIEDYPRSVWADEARYGIGQVYIKQGQYEKAREQFQMLVNARVSDELKEKATNRLEYLANRTK